MLCLASLGEPLLLIMVLNFCRMGSRIAEVSSLHSVSGLRISVLENLGKSLSSAAIGRTDLH